jgi:hypothetical protein
MQQRTSAHQHINISLLIVLLFCSQAAFTLILVDIPAISG